MEFTENQAFTPPELPQNNKKKLFMILGALSVLIIIILPLLFGLLTPTKKIIPSFSTSQNTTQISQSPEINQAEQITSGVARQSDSQSENPQTNTHAPTTPEPTFSLDSLLPSPNVTPTPTPLPGPFYTANTKQNDLTYRLYAPKEGDIVYEVQLINTKTREVRIIGYAYVSSPGDSFYFSQDFSQVIFLGGTKTNHQKISLYSIPKQTVLTTITMQDIQEAIPSLLREPTAVLSRLLLSPDGKKVAISYGKTYSVSLIHPTTAIIVIDLQTKKMRLLPVNGLAKNWKDTTTLEYELNSSDPNTNITQEVKIPNLL